MSSAGSPLCWTRALTRWYPCSTVATVRYLCRGSSPPLSQRPNCPTSRTGMKARSKWLPMAS
eukprot:10070160-Lingulodinium_polyedra.AAC.1